MYPPPRQHQPPRRTGVPTGAVIGIALAAALVAGLGGCVVGVAIGSTPPPAEPAAAASTTASPSASATSSTPAAEPSTTPPTDTPAPSGGPTTTPPKKIKVPDVVGMNHQEAQDLLQSRGLYMLQEQDATGQNRVMVWDRNWVVVKQEPKPGARVPDDETITLYSKKIGE